MDTMERYMIQESIKDVIAILDSSPFHSDLIPETTTVQLTNRMPIAHLAIEKGLKALTSAAGVTPEPIHALNRLFRVLRSCDIGSADYLAMAFEDAVDFFGYNVNVKGFGHFRSLEDYLSKVGTESSFEELRYWAIGETREGGSLIPYISPPIHRELLCALWCLFFPNRRETVSGRVELEVEEAMFSRRPISYDINDTGKKASVYWYMNWLFKEHASRRDALEEAVKQGFNVEESDEFVSQTLIDAYNDLSQSKDPAVRYYVRRLGYLPKGSQRRNPGATPEVQWLGRNQTRGMVETPAGTCLGVIDKYADGGWGITPLEGGLVQETDVAETSADARHYLVNRLTKQVTVTVAGEPKALRIVSERDSFLPSDSGRNYEVEFWDANHGLHPGEQVSVELVSERHQGLVHILEGNVTGIEEQRVTITGMTVFDVRRNP